MLLKNLESEYERTNLCRLLYRRLEAVLILVTLSLKSGNNGAIPGMHTITW